MAEAPRIAQESDSLAAAQAVAARLIGNIEQVVLGKHDEIALVLSALASGGHVLLEDVPGTAKTILARSIAQTIDGTEFARIQCTPDLQPTDVTGLAIYNQKTREFEFRAGPIFANIVLVDEINRAMPRTQSALLEAMAERPGDRRRRHAAAAGAVPRHRDGEPDRAGGNVPAARGAARPLRAALRARLSRRTTKRSRSSLAQRHGHPIASLQPRRRRRRRRDAAAPRSRTSTSTSWSCAGSSSSCARRGDVEGVSTGASVRGSLTLERTARAWALMQGRDHVVPGDVERALPARARPPPAAHAVVRRRDALARPRRGAASRSRSAASSSRRRPRPTGTAQRPASGGVPAAERHTFPLVPRRRLVGLPVRRPAEPAPRPRQRRDRNASVRDRRSGRRRSTGSRARASRRRRGRDEFIVRDHAADEAPRVVVVCDRRPAMGIYAPPLPWLSKPRVVAEATAALVDRARWPRAPTSRRSTTATESRTGCRRAASDVPWLVAGARRRRRRSTRPTTTSPRRSRSSVSCAATCRPELRLRALGLPRRRHRRRLARRVAHGWDVVPVVIQDPVWEQSFPDVALGRRPGRGSAQRAHGARPPVAPRGARAAQPQRAAACADLLAELVSLGLEPVLLGTSDPFEIDRAFIEWAELRRVSRWAR